MAGIHPVWSVFAVRSEGSNQQIENAMVLKPLWFLNYRSSDMETITIWLLIQHIRIKLLFIQDFLLFAISDGI